MVTAEVQSALIHLQDRSARALDTFEAERIERALDEILRRPDSTSPAPFQVRSAMAHAGERLKERRTRVAFGSLERDLETGSVHPGYLEPGLASIEIADMIDSAPLPARDRTLLHLLATGEDAATIAAKFGVPEQRMRERISRLRHRAKPIFGLRENGA